MHILSKDVGLVWIVPGFSLDAGSPRRRTRCCCTSSSLDKRSPGTTQSFYTADSSSAPPSGRCLRNQCRGSARAGLKPNFNPEHFGSRSNEQKRGALSPSWGCSRPGRRWTCIHPSRPQPRGGRYGACGKLCCCGRASWPARCEPPWNRAAPPCCLHRATPAGASVTRRGRSDKLHKMGFFPPHFMQHVAMKMGRKREETCWHTP